MKFSPVIFAFSLSAFLSADDARGPVEAGGVMRAPSQPDAWLGVAVERSDPALAYQLNLSDTGVVARKVCEGSPAEAAGIKEHDLLLTFNGKEIIYPEELTGFVRAEKPGAKVRIDILRQGQCVPLTVTLGECPDGSCDAPLLVLPEGPHGVPRVFQIDKSGHPIPALEEYAADLLDQILGQIESLRPVDDLEMEKAIHVLRDRLSSLTAESARTANLR